MCVKDWGVRERRKKILQANEFLIDNEMDLFSCNLKSLITFKLYNSELNFFFTLSLWYRDFEKIQTFMFSFGRKCGEQNRGWHFEFICSYSDPLRVPRHRGNGSAEGQLQATV